jgi:phage terminase small subunit
MLKFCEQFGLTPSARSRIVAGEGSVDLTDEMEQLLGGGE